MSKEQKQIKITKAKGRPMLTWVGKRPLTQVRAYPAQPVETFSVAPPSPLEGEGRGEGDNDLWADWPDAYPRGGLLFHGDNKDVLAHLLANGFRGKVKLIYIDPPFDSGADYVRKVQLRGAKGSTKVDGEEYTLGEQIQYEDIWANDNYLQFMYERLLMLKELLSEDGSLFLHCDHRKQHYLRCLLDEVFSQNGFVNEVIWRSTTFTGSSKAIANKYPVNHNTVFWYKKGEHYCFNKSYEEYTEEYKKRFSNPDNDPRGPWQSVSLKTYSDETFNRLKTEKRLIPPKREGAGWRFKFYLNEAKGKVLETLWLDLDASPYGEEKIGKTISNEGSSSSIWLDINMANSMAGERTDYPTQKPDELLARLIETHSNSKDIVLDVFLGSGTTVCAAQRLNRRWIGCDINKGAIQTTAKRLHKVMREQAETLAESKQGELDVASEDSPPQPSPPAGRELPAQLSFTTWRVNDYDLQIQHNEAVQLACEHIGITRNRADGYFDGTLGGKLAKIIPFNHPLTPLDLEDLKREINTRPEEERDIVVVCLGLELNARAWVEEHNRNKPINRIGIIELRTDPKYGGFFKHDPLVVSITAERKGEKLIVEVNDVFSPSILQRLNLEQGVFRAQIEDWRAVVDCIMIDTHYDGEVFNVALTDIPARKQDQVTGRYELEAPPEGATIAIKVIDMLGEEAVITQTV